MLFTPYYEVLTSPLITALNVSCSYVSAITRYWSLPRMPLECTPTLFPTIALAEDCLTPLHIPMPTHPPCLNDFTNLSISMPTVNQVNWENLHLKLNKLLALTDETMVEYCQKNCEWEEYRRQVQQENNTLHTLIMDLEWVISIQNNTTEHQLEEICHLHRHLLHNNPSLLSRVAPCPTPHNASSTQPSSLSNTM